MGKIAIIGGTGVYDMAVLRNVTEEHTDTPYGEVLYQTGEYNGKPVVFMARHGRKHSIAPHMINYRANIWALKQLGVTHVLSTTAVGSINMLMEPGDFVFVDQFLDFTKCRKNTFYEADGRGVVHLDVTEPYCPSLRRKLSEAAARLGFTSHNGGVYVCTEGPRFETPAEIRMFERLGGDLVGMTNVPEVVLANEAELCYATISMVTNYAAGISPEPLTHGEVYSLMKENQERLKQLLLKTIDGLDTSDRADCTCSVRLAEFGGFKL